MVAPMSVKRARSIRTERAAGPSPMMRSSWIVLHRGIEDLLHRGIEPVDLVDEEDVALLEVGEQRGEVAGLGDHRTRGGAEVHAELARHDLRQRGLSQPRRPHEQDVVEGFLAGTRRLDEHRQVGACLLLADELDEPLRAQRALGRVVVAALGCHQAAGRELEGVVVTASAPGCTCSAASRRSRR